MNPTSTKLKKLTIRFLIALSFSLSLSIANLSAAPTVTQPAASATTIKKENAEQNKELASKERYLFVQSAHHAHIKKNAKEPGTFIITLHNISPYVTCFTERPIRKVESLPIKQLLGLWEVKDQDSFKNNPPNADISAFEKGDKEAVPLNFAVVLTEPKYDSEAKTLTYNIKALEGNQSKIPESGSLDHVTVFIDDVCLKCWYPR